MREQQSIVVVVVVVTYYIMAFYFLFITSFDCPFPDKEVHWRVSITNA